MKSKIIAGIGLIAFAFLLLLSFHSHAQAATLTVTWTNPVTNVDGSTIPASGAGSLSSTRVEYGTCGANATTFGTKIGEAIVAAPVTTTTFTALASATCFSARAYAKNTYGNESAASNVNSKTTGSPVPNPPILGAVTTGAVEIRQGVNGPWVARTVGSVAIGTQCNEPKIMDRPQLSGGDWYAPTVMADVTLTVDPKTITGKVALRCEGV